MTAPPEEVLDLLTAYVLDALEPEEMARVSDLLQEQPELRETLAELRVTVQQLPMALPDAEPSPDLRQRTLDYALGRTTRPSRRAVPDPAARFRRWMLAWGGALAVATVAAIGGWVQYARTSAELARVQQELATVQMKEQQVAALVSQSQALVELSGASGRGAILRTVNGTTMLAASLPPLPSDRVYQLWLIQGSNAPVSAGVFTVDPRGSGMVVLPPGQPVAADTFAVTNEPVGGSTGPTTPVLIAGKAPAA